MSSKTATTSKRSGLISPLTIAVIVVVLAFVVQNVALPSVTGPASHRKPYTTFPQFYPYYRTEHQDTVNRQLHFCGTSIVILLFLLNLRSLPSLLLGMCVGSLACPLLVGLNHGLVELAIVLATFIGAHKLSTGKIGVSVIIPLVGYTFAWVGHWFFEKNQPATFIYPTFSLMSDFFMWSRIATGVETF